MAASPEDVPTINEILVDFGVVNMLDPEEYGQLIDALAARELTLREDSIIQAAEARAKLSKIANLIS